MRKAEVMLRDNYTIVIAMLSRWQGFYIALLLECSTGKGFSKGYGKKYGIKIFNS